jgi:hypothetical protein
MTSKEFFHPFSSIPSLNRLLIAGLCVGELAAFTMDGIDGIRNTVNEPEYEQRVVQGINGAQENTLANLHSAVTNANLRLFIGGRASGNSAILLFIDSKAGGVPVDGQGPFVPNNLIQSTEFGWMINNLGVSASEGMRFENGFQPDYAIRIQGAGDFDAPGHRFDLQAGTAAALGNAVSATRGGGFISAIRCNWVDVFGNYQDTVNGVEMSLNLPLMGVPTDTGTIKILAMLVSPTSLNASNQTLGTLTPVAASTRPVIGTTNVFNFESEAGPQTLSFATAYTMTDSDGDGLSDAYETNDSSYLSPTATGSDPLNADTDGDSYSDNAEVSGSALGFVSNPNIANYPQIHAPGNFTTPAFVAGAGNEMTRLGTGLAQQYLWQRDYRITNTSFLGTIRFKFSDGGSPAINWGPGSAAGSVALNDNDINASAPATGFYQIGFDQAALTYTFGRRVFPDAAAFLTAYGLASGVDGDGDGILNENEFTANTDPSSFDSDNDGLNDLLDAQPLLAVRDIVFRVNMSLQTELGAFNPAVDSVKVQFIDGLAAPGEFSLSPAGNGVYSGTLTGVAGGAGQPFGGYKFTIVHPNPDPAISEDSILPRNFNLGAAHVTQQLAEVYFDDFVGEGSLAYDTWAEQFETHPGGPILNPDNDAYTNYEEFAFGGDPFNNEGSLIGVSRRGEYLIVSYNERLAGDVGYSPQQSFDLTPSSWVFPEDANFAEAESQVGVPDGYVRTEVQIPIDATAAKFIRIKAIEVTVE